MSSPDCPLCERLGAGDLVAENALAAAFADAFPLTEGHTLVVPRRHVAGLFDLSAEEQAALFGLLPVVKARLDAAHAPDGYNVGVNVGEAAGQTVAHVHVHVIPRRKGDVPDPRGGVRWVMPRKAGYWDPKGDG